MQNIALSVGRSTSSPETSDATAVRPRHLRARSSSLPGIKLTARDPDDADEATRDEVAQSDGLAARGGDDHVVRDEGHGEGVAAHDEARPLPTDISDRIAIEIYERVFDHITDQFTLFIAASISRSWYPRATHWLYHSISIPSRASYDLLVNQLHTSPRVQRWLRSTHKVTLGYRDGSGSNNSGTPFLDTFPLLFGQACPSLQVLDIGRILRPNPHPTFHRALRQFQHVVSLRLHDAELSNIAQLRRIVCALTCLEELALDDLVLIEPQLSQPGGVMLQDVLSRNPCNIRLKRLRVEAHTSDCIKTFGRMVDQWFVCSRICSSLVELVTVFENGEPGPAAQAGHVNRLLQFLGQSLTSFHCENYMELRESCDLAHNTALRQLTLHLNNFATTSP
ncbi:uncharacterized protein B0H18DRAFT_333047 [Fomitopsis serialis]|uniref:uncharacterized protein n=1 Tax=Fomitopsis serialis TaxID=139415 RepID=UPI002007F259|nr:uncharacterized protein B0H18DRAFT_333047 [Neoantrodia serialis]KAH9926791.1 hypothetical protein B0H18DRAFT_333047 [Neoantrodia serialis]